MKASWQWVEGYNGKLMNVFLSTFGRIASSGSKRGRSGAQAEQRAMSCIHRSAVGRTRPSAINDKRSQAMTVIWQPALSAEASRWRAVAHRLTQERFAPLAEELDRAQRYPWENVRALVEHKLAGLVIPREHG